MAPSEDRLRTIIVNNSLYRASASQFNDPFDTACRFVFKDRRKELEALFQRFVAENKIRFKDRDRARGKFFGGKPQEEIVKNAFDRVAKDVGIVSLGASSRSLLMWAHYAQNHSGVCLQFYTPSQPELFSEAWKVQYSSDRMTLGFLDWTPETVILSFVRKSNEWSYEQEWRLLVARQARTLGPFHPAALTGVIYGAKCDDRTVSLVRRLLVERQSLGFPNVSEFQAILSPEHYGLGVFAVGKKAPLRWCGRPSI